MENRSRFRVDAKRGFVLIALFVSMIAGFMSTATPAFAANASIQVIVNDNGTRVPNVKIDVTGPATASGVTKANGLALIEVPSAGSYTVKVDVSTLPKGAAGIVRNPQTLEVKANGIPTTILFRVGPPSTASAAPSSSSSSPSSASATTTPSPGASGSTSVWAQLAQKISSGLIFGLLLALASIGVSLIYGTTGLNNFAHGELVTFGGFIGWTFIVTLGASGWIGILAALVIGAIFGWFQDWSLWKPLRRRGVGLIQIMIVSIGLSLFLRYVFAFIYGPGRFLMPQSYNPVVKIFGVGLTYWNLFGSIIAIVLILGTAYVLNYTKIGKATRAVADNKALAAASGINVDRVIRIVWIGSGALAAIAGVLVAYYQTLNFQSGASILLMIFAAVTLGGLGTAYGALVGSILLSLFVELSTFVIPTSMKLVAALVVMTLILLVRPQGILGKKQRIG